MKLHSVSLTCFIVFSLSGVVSFAYATPQLQFDPPVFVIEHTSVITCLDCSATGDSIAVSVTDNTNTLTFNLNRVLGTNNFESDPIKFTTTPTGSPNEFPTNYDRTIQASALGLSVNTTIKKNYANLLNVDGNSYASGAKTIKKLVIGCVPTNQNIGGDVDGDGICDSWEDQSTFYLNSGCGTGPGLCIRTSNVSPVYRLTCDPNSTSWNNSCPNKNMADIYYEIDYMTGHKPKQTALDSLYTAYATSGYLFATGNTANVKMHIQLDEEVTHTNNISSTGTTSDPGFDQMKGFWFGTSSERGTGNTFPNQILTSPWYTSGGIRDLKSHVFHYVIFAHSLTGCTELNCSSGSSEIPGNDGLVTLGSFYNMIGTLDQQEGTVMHEIGHDVNLNHGGNESRNCKPNYVSVMSYSRQFSDLVSDRKLDYSRSATLAPISETLLPTTSNGLGSYDPAFEQRIVFATPAGIGYWLTGSGTFVPWTATSFNVDALTSVGCNDNSSETLNSFKDWDGSRLKLTARTSSTWWD